jgi:hypothetical protein
MGTVIVRARRLLWFVAIYLLSVGTFASVTFVIRGLFWWAL